MRLLIFSHKRLLMIDEVLMGFSRAEVLSFETASGQYISRLSMHKNVYTYRLIIEKISLTFIGIMIKSNIYYLFCLIQRETRNWTNFRFQIKENTKWMEKRKKNVRLMNNYISAHVNYLSTEKKMISLIF